MLDIEDLRKEYTGRSLGRKEVDADPFRQFKNWFQQALDTRIHEPNAMTLATADRTGNPSARIVLLKGFNQDDGFVFYTNYRSRKGRQLEENPRAALVFLWHELQRQIRIEGEVSRLSREASREYFQSRPRGSQVSAWASPQSESVKSREALKERVDEVVAKFGSEGQLPLPPDWGGYGLKPRRLEFWQGRANRLHDRIEYTWEDSAWIIRRLAP